MGVVKMLIDDQYAAERLARGEQEVYYGEEWPSEQECVDDEQGFNSSEPFRPFSQASDDD